MIIDYHVHTNFSPDSSMSMIEACNRSIENGVKEICFTDHIDLEANKKLTQINIDLESYIYNIDTCKDLFKNRLIIKKGIELGIQPEILSNSYEFLRNYRLDFIIASIHAVKNQYIFLKEYMENKNIEEQILEYYMSLLSSIQSAEFFNVIGHIDVIKRYIPKDYSNQEYDSNFKELIENILKILINKNKGIEVNTSGISYGLNDFHPSKDILMMYKELGGSIITIGSDAHKPEFIGAHVNNAIELLRSIGFKYITVFEEGKPHFIKIT